MEMIYVGLFILLLICCVAWQKRKRADKVGAGLQIFNADGKLTLDTMDKSTFIFGTACTQTVAGRIEDSRIKKDKVFIMPYKKRTAIRGTGVINDSDNTSITARPIVFTIEDGSLSWDWRKYGREDSTDEDWITVTWFIYGGIKHAE